MNFKFERLKNGYAEVFNGKTPSKKEQRSSGKPILKIRDVDRNGLFSGVFGSYVDDKFYEKYSKKILKNNDIIILNAAHSSKYVGSKKCFVTKCLEGVIPTGEWLIIRPHKGRLYGKYLNIYLNSPKGKSAISKIVKGIHLYPKDVSRIKIPIPGNYDDQIRIATLLFRVEEMISKRKESIHLLDDLLKSTFLEMFGTNAEGFDNWPTREIQSLAAKKKRSMRTGPFGSNLLHKEFTPEGDVAVLGIDNAVNNRFEWNQKRFITNKKYETLKNYTIYPRDVIITIMGTTGRSAVVPENIPLAINTKHLAAITLDKLEANPYFLSFSIYSNPYLFRQLRSQNRGAIMRGLNLGIIKKLKIKLPPIELQNHFEYLLKKVESLKAKYETSLQELENLYGSLSQRAFRGELDLSKIPVEQESQPIKIAGIIGIKGSMKIATKIKFDIQELKRLIAKKLPSQFTFDELQNILAKENFDSKPEYLQLKNLLVECLEGKRPFLQQKFDKPAQNNNDQEKKEKQIFFSVTR